MACFNRDQMDRYIVDLVDDKHDDDGCHVKRLIVHAPNGSDTREVVLRDDWAEYTNVQPGDLLTTIGCFERVDRPDEPAWILRVTFKQNAVIVRPEILVPVTSISGSFRCLRKAVLSRLLRSNVAYEGLQNPGLSDAQSGTLLHAIVQGCLQSASTSISTPWDDTFVRRHVLSVASSKLGIDACFRAGLSQASLVDMLVEKLKDVPRFKRLFIGTEPNREAVISEERGLKTLLTITGISAVEKEVRSSLLGIRGQIDVVANVLLTTVHDGLSHTMGPLTVPLEIKTGKARDPPYAEHVGQALLYAIALNGSEGGDISRSLLYYSATSSLSIHRTFHTELRSLLQARNSVAEWLLPRHIPERDNVPAGLSLPFPIDERAYCTTCFEVDNCVLYRKAADPNASVIPDIEELYSSKSRHLDNTRVAFFRTWDQLLDAEDAYSRLTDAIGWALSASIGTDRSNVTRTDEHGDAIVSFTQHRSASHASGIRHGLSVGEDVLLIPVDAATLVERGLVHAVSPDSVDIRLAGHGIVSTGPSPVYRISNTARGFIVACARRNISTLLSAGSRFTRLRSLAIDRVMPQFDQPTADNAPDLSLLNQPQQRALQLALRARDYAVIRGPPGSGKTTLIAALLRELVGKGKSVLLTAHTHSALDSVLMKLHGVSFSVIRLGPIHKVHPAVRSFCPSGGDSSYALSDLHDHYMRAPVIATTALSLEHVVFSRRRFDYCVVDEAAQILLPICLGPILLAERFILVGDENQMQPLLLGDAAHSHAVNLSLFQRLIGAHPNAVAELTHQYRMSNDIMLLSNHLTYGSRMKCGTEEVAGRWLSLPRPWMVSSLHVGFTGTRCWMDPVLDKNNRVLFLDTDGVPARESLHEGLVQNEVEAIIVSQIATAAAKCGILPSDITVLSPYHRQLVLIKQKLGHDRAEFLTIDQSQGREGDFYLVSLVRANERAEVGALVQDPRRLNVAFSRARAKLVIVGSRRTLDSSPYMSELFRLLDSKGWSYTLPVDAYYCYPVST